MQHRAKLGLKWYKLDYSHVKWQEIHYNIKKQSNGKIYDKRSTDIWLPPAIKVFVLQHERKY